MHNNQSKKETKLIDYSPLKWQIASTNIIFDLNEEKTQVTTSYKILLDKDFKKNKNSLWFDAEDIELVSLSINGVKIDGSQYLLSKNGLEIPHNALPDQDTLDIEIVNFCFPESNVKLEGLYLSNGVFTTQCEAEGFRRICFSADRCDQLSVYEVTIRADKKKYPILLSNGNFLGTKDIANGRHEAKWLDPWKKPTYLFALVAGDFEVIRDNFISKSGKDIKLSIYAKEDIDKAKWAMESLKSSMKWDEDAMQREYDLEEFNIIAVPDFNFGAMENKGLNIFNEKLLMANQASATDNDFLRIESVVAHEYFHNWTGNRITCRDWMQLSFKEGLTVFRDQEFSSDTRNRTVQRIQNVSFLMAHQFSEDSGPLSHPVRPDKYKQVNNLYTRTVYEKGAELVRMLMEILGKEVFSQCLQNFFDKYDGKAITVEEFYSCFADDIAKKANADSEAFMDWYRLAGTPLLEFEIIDSKVGGNLKKQIKIKQSLKGKESNFIIPISFAIFDEDSGDKIEDHYFIMSDSHVLVDLSQKVADKKIIVSSNRGFIAPVNSVIKGQSREKANAILAKYEDNQISRFMSFKDIFISALQNLSQKNQQNITDSMRSILSDNTIDYAVKSCLLENPHNSQVINNMDVVDPFVLINNKLSLRKHLANNLKDLWLEGYNAVKVDADDLSDHAMGVRSFRNICLYYLDCLSYEYSKDHEKNAKNFTERLAALSLISHRIKDDEHLPLLKFGDEVKEDRMLYNSYLGIRSISLRGDAKDFAAKSLKDEEVKSDKVNPNRVHCILLNFASNLQEFHKQDMSGYNLLKGAIKDYDKKNPMVSSRLVEVFANHKKYADPWKSMQKSILEEIAANKNSSHLSEMLEKILNF